MSIHKRFFCKILIIWIVLKLETYFENYSNPEDGYSGNYDGGSGNDEEGAIDIDGSEPLDTCAGIGKYIIFSKNVFWGESNYNGGSVILWQK